MPDPLHDLLIEPIFTICGEDHSRSRTSLPGLLARLSEGRATEYTTLQVHQQQPWHAFLVQLGAIALHGAGKTDPPIEDQSWRGLLLALTEGRHEPWCLVVEDLSKPAFLQPPVPEGSLKGFRNIVATPDGTGVDLLLTTRNHDVKSGRALRALGEHWVFALATLQTQQGYSGKMNHGIARMNGGFASRPHTAFASSLEWPSRFRRDVQVLLTQRSAIVASHGYADREGENLLWLLPWEGKRSLSLAECDPFFVEVCRRVRLRNQGGFLLAHLAPSERPRIEARGAKGNTGDAWTPVTTADGKSLTVDRSGFSYRLVAKLLLSGEFRPGSAMVLTAQDGNMPLFLASALARGQGKTEGFHERSILIPKRARGLLATLDGRDRLHRLAQARVDAVASIQKRVLKPALCALLQADPPKLRLDDKRVQPFLDALDNAIDREFFQQLWHDVEAEAAEAEARWALFVLDLAEKELQRAIDSVPLPSARLFRAVAAAERLFAASKRKRFPQVFQKKESSPS